MVLLCAGVFIVGSTFKADADTLTVTATVHAELPTQPAVITSPFDQQHVSDSIVDVSGTCPDGAYVKLYRNDEFAGVAQCIAQAFQLQISLVPGANKLQARVYNITDDEGPQSPPITVYYDVTTVTPQQPTQEPTGLTVLTIDGAPYRSGVLPVAGSFPTITGLAPPFSKVTISVRPEAIECKTVASKYGWWTCTFAQSLPPGLHTVEVSAVTPDGRALRFPSFQIRVVPGTPGVQRPIDGEPLVVHATYRYQAHYVDELWNWDIGIRGGASPYKVTIDWGDRATTNRDREQADIFTISHAYKEPGVYYPVVRVVDNGGKSNQIALMQLMAIVKPATGAPIGGTTSAPKSGIEQYLWLIWPTYLAIVLMVVSFWLGEQEIMRKFRPGRHAK